MVCATADKISQEQVWSICKGIKHQRNQQTERLELLSCAFPQGNRRKLERGFALAGSKRMFHLGIIKGVRSYTPRPLCAAMGPVLPAFRILAALLSVPFAIVWPAQTVPMFGSSILRQASNYFGSGWETRL